MIGGGRSATEGVYPLNNDRALYTANARFAWNPRGATDFVFATRFSDSESHYPTDDAGNIVDQNQSFEEGFTHRT